MLEHIDPGKVLFLDIETVSRWPTFAEMPDDFQHLWDDKTRFQRGEETAAEFYPKRAGILAEFGKVVCISCGFFAHPREFRLKSFFGDDEFQVLSGFAEMLGKHFSGRDHLLCAHNGKEFDFPYLCRRMVVHGIALPPALNIAGKKPWEVPHLDTLELWKFGDYKNYTSLKLLAALFGIPTPKDDIDGSQVGRVYWEENDIKRIAKYCEKDTLTVAQLFLRYRGDSLLKAEEVISQDF